MKASNDIYIKSNQITTVDYNSFSKKEYANLLKDRNRQEDAQALIDYLCKKFKIRNCVVKVTNKPQPHSTGYDGNLKSKTLGTYTVGMDVITMYNVTAIKNKEVSIKTFADTLLHEFIHHYDMEYLKLGASIHTTGFYKRISDLKSKLI